MSTISASLMDQQRIQVIRRTIDFLIKLSNVFIDFIYIFLILLNSLGKTSFITIQEIDDVWANLIL